MANFFSDVAAKMSYVVAAAAITLDFLFHRFYTTPMETTFYFAFKFLLAFYVAKFLFRRIGTLKRYFWFSVLFAALFSVYYRVVEVVTSKAYLSRVPDIHIDGLDVIASNDLLLAGAVWGVIHGGVFFAGIFVAKYLRKKRVV